MAGDQVRSVSVVFRAFTDKLEKGLQKASGKVESFQKKLLKAAAGFVAARFAVGQFTSQFDKLNKLGKLSDALQVSPDFLRGLEMAAESVGESFEGAQDLVREFNVRMGEARTGAGPAIEGLRLLGMTIEDFTNSSPEDAFLRVADALSQIEDPQLQMFAAGELFGGKGEDMLALLQQGKEGLREFIQMAKDAGPISRNDIKRIEEAQRATQKMKMAWESIIQRLTIAVAPMLEMIAKAVDKIAQGVNKIGDAWKSAGKVFENEFLRIFYNAGLISKEEFEFAKSLPDQAEDAVRKITTKMDIEPKIKGGKIKAFVEELAVGSSAAFRVMNQSVRGGVEQQQLSEQKKGNQKLDQINATLENGLRGGGNAILVGIQ